MADIVGWDIGGAHLKAARLQADGRIVAVVQLPCPLWRGLEHLEQAVDDALEALGDPGQHAITMTGELADIFANRTEGVARIVAVMQKKLASSELRIFAGMQGFVAPQQAEACAVDIASANWLASAGFAARKVTNGIFVDVGSTTTDIVLLQQGRAEPQGMTDAARLATDELVYTGAIRTPLMAVAQKASFNGERQRLAAEHFATMADVYRLTGQLDAGHDMAETADGAGKTPHASARRLARMVGRDVDEAEMKTWVELAQFFAETQLQDIRTGVERVGARSADSAIPLVGAGAGRFVVRALAAGMSRPYLDFADLVEGDAALRDWAAVCAPAYAVAWLGVQT